MHIYDKESMYKMWIPPYAYLQVIGFNKLFFFPAGMKTVIQKGFVGCLSDLFLKKMYTPYEYWESLNWQNAEEQNNVYHIWEGCPVVLSEGAHFLGKGSLPYCVLAKYVLEI